MNRAAQSLILTAVGALALRVSITDEYSRYVNEWMRWPLLFSGVFLVGLAFTAVLRHSEDEHSTTPAAWALLIPVILGLVVQPPALGSYVAERSVNPVADGFEPPVHPPLVEGEANDLPVSTFVVLALSHSEVIEGHSIRLTGFATSNEDGWYVTRVKIRCCAADASAYRVQVEGAPAPPDDQWVEVTGTWVEGTGTAGDEPPVLTVDELTEIAEPKRPYE